MSIIATAGRMNWSEWIKGILRSIISGGSGAVGSTFGTTIIDPEHFQFKDGQFHNVLAVAGITFSLAATLSLAAYLQQHPIPDDEEDSNGDM